MLTPADVIAGAHLASHPSVYVLGFYDSRITFYSQQVRALELAHALQHEHRLPANARVAVVGGGAAGVTVAAALALQGGTQIHLFEKSHQLLPLQADSQRRRLDPHIYDWPNADAEHELAQLPILDWRSGSAVDVRDAVLREFGEIQTTTEGRLVVNTRHEVKGIVPASTRYAITSEREGPAADRETVTQDFDVIILAIGFGIEPRSAISNTSTASYWRDAGVPGAEIEGRSRPTFFVSGNGDGGLIDTIASASAVFRHDDIVRGLAQRPGVMELREALMEIDQQALVADAEKKGFDFLSAYDTAIGSQVETLGLIDDMRTRLRPGVQIVVQTREPELLTIKTARLNRLAVYVLSRACDGPRSETFTHVVCDDVSVLAPQPEDHPNQWRLQCGTQTIIADWIIARRGPGRDAIRAPFKNLLAEYEAAHADWVRRFARESIAPTLSSGTRAHFVQLAARAKLSPPRYHLDALIAAAPRSGKLAMTGTQAKWSGDLALSDIGSLWASDRPSYNLTISSPPDQLGEKLALAVARLIIHAPRAELLVDVARWEPFIAALSSGSQCAGGLSVPRLNALGGHPSILNPVTSPPDVLAATINQALDAWLLEAVDHRLKRYIEHGEDPGHAVSFVAAPDLRTQMEPIWRSWRIQFQADPALWTRFLALAVCAAEEPNDTTEALVLPGRNLLTSLVRACAVALVVATAWQETTPRGATPGNLSRDHCGTARTGHACAAGLIDSQPMAHVALRHAWTTEFVVLPMQSTPLSLIISANTSLAASDSGPPLLGQPGPQGKLMLTVDSQFVDAATTSSAALSDLLLYVEERHYAALRVAIQSAGASGA